jgi:hypothetical protein
MNSWKSSGLGACTPPLITLKWGHRQPWRHASGGEPVPQLAAVGTGECAGAGHGDTDGGVRAQQLVAVSFFLLAPYIAGEAIRALATGDRAETTIVGLVLTAGTAVLEPALGVAKRRLGARLGSAATAGEGTQNLLCACLAVAVFAGLAANTLLGAWWLDGVVALGTAGWAVVEGRRAWAGRSCGCASQPGAQC